MRRASIKVGGRVQGVFFRVSCAERARELGLAGLVRNLPDGRVEVICEGPVAAVEAMLVWCREGPPLAEVRSVEVADEPLTGEPDFRITG